MRDLMIDIETLGQKPGSVILSIGAVNFDALTGKLGEEFYAQIDPETAASCGLTIDVSTIKWWMKQSPEAQHAAFSGERDLKQALVDLGEYVLRSEATRVWAKPPSFDLVLLEETYRAVGHAIPWKYWECRDCRTLFDIAGITPEATGTAHNALDDAKTQALAVIRAYRDIAITGRAAHHTAKYRNSVDGKTYELMAESEGLVTFRREGRDTPIHLGSAEFYKRYQAIPIPAPASNGSE